MRRPPRRICVVTTGQLSTSPRMVKAADALADAGYDVRVVSMRRLAWANAADLAVHAMRRWRWTPVEITRSVAPAAWLTSGLRARAAQLLARTVGAERLPATIGAEAYCRARAALVRAVVAEPVELVYGGTGAGLPVAVAAARRLGVPWAVDLEDLHHAENPGDAVADALAAQLERAAVPGAAFVTAGSRALADAYAARFDRAVLPVHNVFPLPAAPPSLPPGARVERLRMYWFSQTIGPGRGLDDAVRAMGRAALDGELHLRGRAQPAYADELTRLAAREAPRLALRWLPPAAPDDMVACCDGFDLGLALEQRHPPARDLCVTNKALTYLLAGVPVALTATSGHRELAADLGEGAIVVPPGDVEALAAALRSLVGDGERLARARRAAWDAARRRWHWEHPAERGALLRAVEVALR